MNIMIQNRVGVINVTMIIKEAIILEAISIIDVLIVKAVIKDITVIRSVLIIDEVVNKEVKANTFEGGIWTVHENFRKGIIVQTCIRISTAVVLLQLIAETSVIVSTVINLTTLEGQTILKITVNIELQAGIVRRRIGILTVVFILMN